MKNFILAAAALCFSLNSAATASEAVTDENYFKTGAVTVTSEVTERALTADDAFPVPLRNESKIAGAAIVNGGVQAWNVINSGKPDGSLSSSYASAIPGFSFNWANFSGWKKKEVVYTYTVTNLMQVDVIKIKYAISFYYNGQDLVGAATQSTPETTLVQRNAIKGHYITNFTVRPLSMNIKWGWKFSLNVRMSDPMNVGTADKPVAYLQSDLSYIVGTPFSSNGGMWTYDITGLGAFRDLSAQNKELTKEIPSMVPAEVSPVSWN
jgi:hypothetical protein